jgi:trans-2,3-dihydro-3-hydroxyanthranilate isomerase
MQLMTQIRIYQVDAFTHIPFGGNPAGVVPDANGLSEQEMQRIARELNCSETAFVLPSERPNADLRLRYFTPQEEVDLCGHATISAFVALGLEHRFEGALPRTVILETKAGLLPVIISCDEQGRQLVLMTQAAPQFRPCEITRAEVARLLGLVEADLDPELPLGLAYTGLWDLMIPIRTLDAFARMKPDLDALAACNRKLGVTSTHCYSLEVVEPTSHLHARNFAPAVGIPEDPASGTANGALAAFLLQHGVLTPKREQVRLIVEQGFECNRPSYVYVELDGEPCSPRTVRVGGSAVPVFQGTMQF